MHRLPRRGLFRAAGGALLGGAATGAVSGRVSSATTGPTAQDWRALAASIDGEVVRRSAEDYHRVRVLFNTRFDGARPRAVVRAVDASDVAEAIRFARRFGLRCRARAGGHSYVGASTVDDGLVIDVRPMRSLSYDAATSAVTIGAGASSYRVHEVLAAGGRSVATGTCPTVGVTGLALGGGLGIDSTSQGLSCDALTGLTLVTADSRVRQVDPGRHPGLWWASHGGGGGNFGVVTSMRLRTHSVGPMGLFTLTYAWQDAASAIRGWAARIEAMPRSVWCNLQLVVDAGGTASVQLTGRCHPGDQDAEVTAWERAIGVEPLGVWTVEKPYMEAVRWFGGGSTNPRSASVAGSDVVAAMPETLSEVLPRLLERLAASGTVSRIILDPLTGAVRDQQPGATPFPWRQHLAELQWFVRFPTDPTREAVTAARAWIHHAHEAIAPHSAGAYVNRLEPGRPLVDYYGANLARLRRIKAQVDPDGFFRSPYGL